MSARLSMWVLESPELRQDLALIELKEARLIWSNLVDVDMAISGLHELLNFLPVLVDVGPAEDRFGDVLVAHKLRRLLKMTRQRQFLTELAGYCP